MIIRNQVLIKWPWLLPVCSLIGAAYVFLQANGLSFVVKVAVYVGTEAAINLWFFSSLKQTRSALTKNSAPGKQSQARQRSERAGQR
jgi:hypothetical protein